MKYLKTRGLVETFLIGESFSLWHIVRITFVSLKTKYYQYNMAQLSSLIKVVYIKTYHSCAHLYIHFIMIFVVAMTWLVRQWKCRISYYLCWRIKITLIVVGIVRQKLSRHKWLQTHQLKLFCRAIVAAVLNFSSLNIFVIYVVLLFMTLQSTSGMSHVH